MYASNDPRAGLSSASGTTPKTDLMLDAHVVRYGVNSPQIDDTNGRSWFLRGQTFVISYTEAKAGAVLERQGQPDEYVVLLHAPETNARISWQGETVDVPGHSIVFVPSGDSRVELPNGGAVVRLFTENSTDLTELCPNNAGYSNRAAHIPPLKIWPDPVGGFKVRHYNLDVKPQEGRFGRIFRCTTFMVNYFDPAGPRDAKQMSPHFHDDFEQCSLALEGSYRHFLRWPWVPDMTKWREDVNMLCDAPSAAIIPPPVIHTSQALAETNQLVDIFCPPRIDFSQKPGWVLNADDYPMPKI